MLTPEQELSRVHYVSDDQATKAADWLMEFAEGEMGALRKGAEGLAASVETIVKPLGDETEDSGNPCISPSPESGRAIAKALKTFRAKYPPQV